MSNRTWSPGGLQGFRRRVMTHLVREHRVSASDAVRLLSRWDKYIRARWNDGHSAESVAGHLAKWSREKIVCPCGSANHTARDHARRRRGGWYRRDAENPQPGEVFESKEGKRWAVRSMTPEGKIVVDSAGLRPTGTLIWNKRALARMKEIQTGVPWNPFEKGDVSKKRGRKKTAAAKKSSVKKSAAKRKHGQGSTFLQSIAFNRKAYTVARAKAWLKKNGYKYGKVDTTANYHRFRQVAPGKAKVFASKWLDKNKKILGTVAKWK